MQLTITNVTKRYGDVVALDDPSFTVPSGSTFGVLGTNGAGKTTLFELLVGHDRPDGGTIEVGGLDVEAAGHRVRERVGFLPEHTGFPDDLTGHEVLSMAARIRAVSNRRERVAETLDLVGLADAADRRVEGYSNGMGRRLGLAAALLSRPPVLVLDEPTAGLDPRGVATFHDIITRIDRETDATVILSSHVLEEVERLCDEVVVLEDGQLRAAGPVDELRTQAGGPTRIRLEPAGEDPASKSDNRERILEQVTGAGSVEHADDALVVSMAGEEALGLLGELDERAVAGFEVNQPGLDVVFRNALDAEDASEGDGEVAAAAESATTEVSP